MDGGKSSCQCDQPKPYPTMQSAPYLFYDKKGVKSNESGYPAVPGGATYPPVSMVTSSNPPVLPEGTTSLHFALGNLKTPDIEMILKQNPEAVKEIGFNGQTPLHKAVLGSDIMVIDMLLRFHADPNAHNNFQETPLHFACKRGNPMMINLLLQNGADINAVDKAGKGAIHHSAHGGSVYGLHYLTEACGLNTHVRDVNLSTPLHIVCAHGHVEALAYLLKKDRTDMFAQNAHGNNVLHIAANAGHGWTCWRLLEEGGLSLQHEENREGNTPLDLARSHKDPKYSETINLLAYYTSGRQKSGRAFGPVLGWYAHGLMPLVLYPLILLLAYQTSRPGAFTSAGLVVLLIMIYQHSHRMQHICRWPNPIFFGMFAAGMLHSLICFYVKAAPVIYESHSFLVQMMVLWNILLVYVYGVLLVRSPGEATTSAPKPGSLWSYSIRDIADGNIKLDSLCVACELIPPRLTHHCKLCVMCYLNTDHHCLFLYRCIARNNHRLFIIFVAMVTVAIMMFLYSMALYFGLLYPQNATYRDLVGEIFADLPWEWSLFLANAVCVFWGLNLLRFQVKVVSKAQTTVHQPNEGRTSLTARQRLYNVVYFFMGKGYFATDAQFTA